MYGKTKAEGIQDMIQQWEGASAEQLTSKSRNFAWNYPFHWASSMSLRTKTSKRASGQGRKTFLKNFSMAIKKEFGTSLDKEMKSSSET